MMTTKYGLENTLLDDMSVLGDEMTISPNPCLESIQIRVSRTGPSFLFIYDVDGKLVQKEMVSRESNRISISQLTSGLYTAILCSGNFRNHGRFLKI